MEAYGSDGVGPTFNEGQDACAAVPEQMLLLFSDGAIDTAIHAVSEFAGYMTFVAAVMGLAALALF